MEILRSHADTRSETYRENRAGFLEQIALLNEQLELVRAGGGEKYVKRHEGRGKLIKQVVGVFPGIDLKLYYSEEQYGKRFS